MVRKTLLIKRGAMGDILMTTPMLRQLKANYPDMHIDYCVSNSFKSTLLHNPYLNMIIDLPDDFFSIKGILKLIRFLITIKNNYDYVYVLGKSNIYNLLVKYVMNAQVIGFARGFISTYILDYAIKYDNVYKYQAIYYLELLRSFHDIQIDYTDLSFDLYLGSLSSDNSFQLISGDYVVITNSGGNNQFEQTGIRMLPDNIMVSLIKLLVNKYKVILLGGTLDYDNYQRYVELVNHPQVYNYAGKYDLANSIRVLQKSVKFITTDCGAMHLGLIAGIQDKMVCVFGATNYYHILPPNFNGHVIWDDYQKYAINYQLYGKNTLSNEVFFTNINVDKLTLGWLN